MRSKELYSFIAVLLPVSLGLGLIYLHGVGRIGAFAALATVVGLGALMVVAAALADMAAQEPRRGRRDRPVRL